MLCCSYNPHKNLIVAHLREIQVALDVLSSKYENIIIIGDFNSEPTESMIDFCQPYKMENLINNFTCYKNPNKPTCIDLMLTNKPRSFKNSSVLETGLSDFHKMTLTVMRAHFVKQTPKVVYYHDYKKFSNELFRNDILRTQALTETKENVQTNIVNVFNEHAPLKKRYVRANQAPFMNKRLSKEFTTRSRLRNKFLKTKTDANTKVYNKQRNYCVSLFRRKKSFFNNLDTKKIVDNKRFWRTFLVFFSDKNRVKNKITLIEEKTKFVSNNNLIAETFNKFSANIVPSLGLQCKDELLASVEHIQDPLEKIIEKFKQHPSIIAIMKHRPNKSNFLFSRVAKRSIEFLIKTLDSSKTIQKDNIPTKIIKENIDIMSNIFHEDINKCFSESFFPDDLKRVEVIPVFKKDIKKDSKTLK